MNLQTRLFTLFSAAVIVLIALVGCAPARVTAPPEPTATSSPTAIETPIPLPTDTPSPTETATLVPTATNTPTPEATPTLTAEQQKEYQKQVTFIQKWFPNVWLQTPLDKITITPVLNGNKVVAIVADKLTERIIADGIGNWLYNNPDNISGIDILPDGTQVFNPNLINKILQDVKDDPSAPSKTVGDQIKIDYLTPLIRQVWSEAASLIGVDSSKIACDSVFLGNSQRGHPVWGIVVGKKSMDGGLSDSKRYIYYKNSSDNIVHIRVYYPNYLFYYYSHPQ